MDAILRLNPLFKVHCADQSIIVKNIFSDDTIYELKSKNTKMLYDFMNKFNGEGKRLEEIIKEYDKQYHRVLKKFVNDLSHKVFLVKDSKNDSFSSVVLEKITKISESEKNVNFQQLARIVVNKVPNLKVCIVHDEENKTYIDEFNRYYFNNVSYCNLDDLDGREVDYQLEDKDLYIVLINHLSFNKLSILNKHIKNSDKVVVLVQHSSSKISIGPLLLPNVLGCIHCLELALMDVRNIESIPYKVNENSSEILDFLIHSYLYDEILNFYIDKLSNFSTSYCKLIGTSITINLNENSVYKINAMKDPKCEICY